MKTYPQRVLIVLHDVMKFSLKAKGSMHGLRLGNKYI